MSTTTRSGPVAAADRFDQRAVQARRRPLRRVVGLLVALLVVGAGVWAVGWSSLLSVRSVEVSGVEGAEAQAVLAAAQVPVGTPMARLDLGPVTERVSARPTLSDVSVERSWPSTVVVHVVPRTPALVARTSAGLRLVDAEGVAYATVRTAPRGLPTVTATGGARAVTPEALQAAVEVHGSLPEALRAKVTAITVTSADLVTLRVGATTILWGGPDDAETKIKVLDVLLRTTPKTIDVSVPDRPVTT